MIKTLDDSTCFQLLKFAKSLCLNNLYSPAKRHILYYFKRIVGTEDFSKLCSEEAVDILSNKYINCDSELDIVDAVNKWYAEDPGKKEASLLKVLDCVCTQDLSDTEWEMLSCHDIVTGSSTGQTWFHQKNSQRTKKKTSLDRVSISFFHFVSVLTAIIKGLIFPEMNFLDIV